MMISRIVVKSHVGPGSVLLIKKLVFVRHIYDSLALCVCVCVSTVE